MLDHFCDGRGRYDDHAILRESQTDAISHLCWVRPSGVRCETLQQQAEVVAGYFSPNLNTTPAE